jgi:glutaredoxin 3
MRERPVPRLALASLVCALTAPCVLATGCEPEGESVVAELVASLRARVHGRDHPEAEARATDAAPGGERPAREPREARASRAARGEEPHRARVAPGEPPRDLSSRGPATASRVYYQFTDDAGRVHFVERLADVPERWRDRVGFVELEVAPPVTPGEGRRARKQLLARDAPSREAPARRVAVRPAPSRAVPEVLLYYADWCAYCRKAKACLDRRRVAYQLRDVDIPAVRRELVEKTGQRGIPVIEVDGRILSGFDERRLDELLSGAT